MTTDDYLAATPAKKAAVGKIWSLSDHMSRIGI